MEHEPVKTAAEEIAELRKLIVELNKEVQGLREHFKESIRYLCEINQLYKIDQ